MMLSTLAMESPVPQECQPNTLCTEDLQERCLPVWRWNLLVLQACQLNTLCTEELQERCLPVWRWNLLVLQACQLNTLCTEELQERCLPVWRWNLQVLSLVNQILSVRKNYRSAAFLSGDGISRSSALSSKYSLYGRTTGALPSCLAMESPGPQACQSNTLCKEELYFLGTAALLFGNEISKLLEQLTSKRTNACTKLTNTGEKSFGSFEHK